MLYATLDEENYVAFAKEEVSQDKLVPYEWVIECERWTYSGVPNGFVMVQDGIMLIENEIIELFVKFNSVRRKDIVPVD